MCIRYVHKYACTSLIHTFQRLHKYASDYGNILAVLFCVQIDRWMKPSMCACVNVIYAMYLAATKYVTEKAISQMILTRIVIPVSVECVEGIYTHAHSTNAHIYLDKLDFYVCHGPQRMKRNMEQCIRAQWHREFSATPHILIIIASIIAIIIIDAKKKKTI